MPNFILIQYKSGYVPCMEWPGRTICCWIWPFSVAFYPNTPEYSVALSRLALRIGTCSDPHVMVTIGIRVLIASKSTIFYDSIVCPIQRTFDIQNFTQHNKNRSLLVWPPIPTLVFNRNSLSVSTLWVTATHQIYIFLTFRLKWRTKTYKDTDNFLCHEIATG
jgi:hypothetical protein